MKNMTKDNAVLMQMARESLRGKWNTVVPIFLIYIIITSALQGVSEVFPLAGLISLILSGPIALGISIFSLNIAGDNDLKAEQLFEGFKNFGTSVVAYLLMVIFILLWSILLIIPGIIAALSYSMTFFIIAEDSSIDAVEALKKSKEMMDGHKWKYFCLSLRFIGWALICILTLGIGFLWLLPYIQVTNVKFYEDIKEANLSYKSV
tara:strand:- start:192 stop:809 length:618 start_codon:yes stop_codon:yes gene_type:complete